MDRNQKFLLVGGGVALLALLATGGVLGVEYWRSSANAQRWAPVIGAAEAANGIPSGLLARMAYQESGYSTGVIDGTQSSSAGALGILQLMPQYFSTVNVPRPYSDASIEAQINQAAQYLASLYNQFGDWPTAVAAYNDGPGNINAYLAGTQPLPAETQNYVAKIFADVPSAGNPSTILS